MADSIWRLENLANTELFSRLSLMAHSPMFEFQSEKVIGNIKVRTNLKNYKKIIKSEKLRKKTKKETLDRPPSRGKFWETFTRTGERAI